MPVTLMPDVIVLLRKCLLASSDVTAIVSQRVATVSPQDTSTPWIRLTRIGGPTSQSAPMRFDKPLVQVDCFGAKGAGDEGAMVLARTARACLLSAAGYADTEVIIAYVLETLGPMNQPDTSRTPPTPRVHFTLAITTHPTP